MSESEALSYVQASALVLGLPLSADRAQRVATHLQRTAALAERLEQFPLTPEDELAEIYHPQRPEPGQDSKR